jgi:lysozyme
MANMVDVSSNNHVGGRPLSWRMMRDEAGIRYAMIKATEGLTYVNPWARIDAPEAVECGIEVGFYHFAEPTTGGAGQEADFFGRTVAKLGVPHRIGLALDLEVRPPGWGWNHVVDWAKVFLGTLSDWAEWTILYANDEFLTNLPDAPWGHRLWYARPGARPRRQCWAWQYGTGREPAVEGIDVDELFELPA